MKSKVFIEIIKVDYENKFITVSVTQKYASQCWGKSFPWYWSAKGKHTESIIFQTAQQMNLCPWTNKKHGLKWYWHFNIVFSETQKQVFNTSTTLIFTWIV